MTVKGLNTIADMFGNPIKFRIYEVALILDIINVYNFMKTSLVEKNLQKIDVQGDSWIERYIASIK